MTSLFKSFAFSALYFGMILLLALATFLERAYGTSWAHTHLYGSLCFVFLWALFALGILFAVIRTHMFRTHKALFFLHISMLLIFLGGFCTWAFGTKGSIHLRQGVSANSFTLDDGSSESLPFSVSLSEFQLSYYPGTDAVSDYVSLITICESDSSSFTSRVSMNHILNHHSYRFYQSSFDTDHLGTYLTVSHDPLGITFAYIGYALFLLAAILLLITPSGAFRKLLRRHHALTSALSLTLLFSLFPISDAAANTSVSQRQIVVRRTTADSMALQQVLYNHRIAPFSTVATDVLRKVYGKNYYHGLSAEQVILSLVLYPQQWSHEPIIRISSSLRDSLSLPGKYASIADLYASDGTYRLQQWWNPSRPNDPLQKEIAQTDERLSLLTMLCNGSLFSPLSHNNPHRLSPFRLHAEVFYNHFPLPSYLFKILLSLGLIAFLFVLIPLFRSTSSRTDSKNFAHSVLYFLNILCTLSLLLFYAFRWFIANHVPLTNGYETMLFLSLIISLCGVLLARRSTLLLAASFLMSGLTLLVASLTDMNPQLTALMPVLSSPWLSAHVSLVMIAYSLFTIAFFISLIALISHVFTRNPDSKNPLHLHIKTLVQLLILPAVLLLAIGIFLGSVWANVSWGSYWTWDPKEVWALITLMTCAIPLHPSLLPPLRKPIFFHLFILLSFLTLLMTYFGVNLLFQGMHSYK